MKYHFKIIDKKTQEIHINREGLPSDSQTFLTTDGFSNEEEFEGYHNEEIARFWARDRMKLYSLSGLDYDIVINSVIVPVKVRNHIYQPDKSKYTIKKNNDYFIS